MGPNACNWIIGAQESHENALQTSNMSVWYKKDTTSIAVSVIKSQFYGEFLVNYSNIWFNMGPSACNWIIGMQESHEKGLQIGWEGFHRALE